MVIRSSIERPRMASPVYSNTWPVPPPTPMREMRLRMMSLAVTPGPELAVDAHLVGARRSLEQRLGGQHHLDLGRADAERERPERAVGRGVRVAAHDGHARLRQAQLGADDMDDALVVRAAGVDRDAELGAVALQLVRSGRRPAGRGWAGCRGVVGVEWSAVATVRSGWRTRQAPVAEALERLGAGDLVDEVQVDADDARGAGLLEHDVLVPDLLDERARSAGRSGCGSVRHGSLGCGWAGRIGPAA